jgi:hypothetical protein
MVIMEPPCCHGYREIPRFIMDKLSRRRPFVAVVAISRTREVKLVKPVRSNASGK